MPDGIGVGGRVRRNSTVGLRFANPTYLNFERIHRTNLIGMGVLPLEFKPGTTRLTLGIDGTEEFDVVGERKPRTTLTLVVTRRSGEKVEVPMTCRLDSDEEVSVYEAGGVLQRFAMDFLESSKGT